MISSTTDKEPIDPAHTLIKYVIHSCQTKWPNAQTYIPTTPSTSSSQTQEVVVYVVVLVREVVIF